MKRLLSLTLFLSALACDGAYTGPDNDAAGEILVVGLARQDLSPIQPLEGYIVLFYDLSTGRLLTASADVSGTPVATEFTPGTPEGTLYVQGAEIESGTSYVLTATVAGTSVYSSSVLAPAPLEIAIPANHPIDEPLSVTWTPPGDASMVNISLQRTGFVIDVPASDGIATIPADAFALLGAGEVAEIEVTTYNVFYATLNQGINSLSDAEAFAGELSVVDNIVGAGGAFGAATTVGAIVLLE